MSTINKKILIISASIGSGHTQAAKALQERYEQLEPQAEVVVVDFFDGEYALGKFMKDTYFNMLELFPEAYEVLYRYSQKSFFNSNVKSIMSWAMKTKLKRLLAQYTPDLVICTHPIPCCAAAYLRYKKQLPQSLAAVITDFTLHQLWQYPEVDAYFVASRSLQEELQKQGISATKIFVTGMPLRMQFSQAQTVFAREPATPSVLLMGGGLGLGAVEEVVAQLQAVQHKIKITVVTGSNESLRQRLLKWNYTRQEIEILGYVDNIASLMAKSSLLITKPGGLTCSEALAMALPMLLFSPLPGQEEDNARYLKEQGVGIIVTELNTVSTLVDTLFRRENELTKMQMQAAQRGNAAATQEIIAVLEEVQREQKIAKVI